MRTVLILGAGASAEVRLPVGSALKEHISKVLNFLIEEGRAAGGDSEVLDCFRADAKEKGTRDINPYLQAARQIRSGMPHALSIDNFLHQRRDDDKIEFCGKLAIVRTILDAEERSSLKSSDDQYAELTGAAKTWLNGFFQLLVENCGRDDLETRLQQLEVISFNYDRVFEHFLFNALRSYYNLKPERAAELASFVPVHHPYGQVGFLPWQQTGTHPWSAHGGRVPYGCKANRTMLLELAKQIKTFTEGTDPHSPQLAALRKSLNDAERVVYLGFGFHDQNMQLLYGDAGPLATERRVCIGTAHEVSYPNLRAIMDELSAYEGFEVDDFDNAQCAAFVAQRSRSLRFRS